jgi:GNAT superfamily N-acetyltransferase
MMKPVLTIRPAVEDDLEVIMSFVLELAEYQNLLHDVTGTMAMLRENLFGPKPAAEVLMGCVDEVAAGMALFFQTFSTFTIKPGIYLEDLYVRPRYRGLGLGKQLLIAVAKLNLERGGGWYDWSVLPGNQSAIDFYEGLGAKLVTEWRHMRVEGEALEKLAGME